MVSMDGGMHFVGVSGEQIEGGEMYEQDLQMSMDNFWSQVNDEIPQLTAVIIAPYILSIIFMLISERF